MRAYELMKETFSRKMHIWIVHVVWLVLYACFWVLFLNEEEDVFGQYLFIWGGFLLPLALSAGIFGDDIASGRIRVLMTKPFWPGELYIYRFAPGCRALCPGRLRHISRSYFYRQRQLRVC